MNRLRIAMLESVRDHGHTGPARDALKDTYSTGDMNRTWQALRRRGFVLVDAKPSRVLLTDKGRAALAKGVVTDSDLAKHGQ